MEKVLVALTKLTGCSPILRSESRMNQFLTSLFALFIILLNSFEVYLISEAYDSVLITFSCFIQATMTFSAAWKIFFSINDHYKYNTILNRLEERCHVKEIGCTLNATIFIGVLGYWTLQLVAQVTDDIEGIPIFLMCIVDYIDLKIFVQAMHNIVALMKIRKCFSFLNGKIKYGKWNYAKVHYLLDLHDDINRLVDLHNRLFGVWTCLDLALVLFLILGDIWAIMFYGLELWNSIVYLTVPIAVVIGRSLQCNRIEVLGRETAILAQVELRKHLHVSALNKDLFLFFKRARQRRPQFSAGGFIIVNNALLFNCFNLIVTYMLACISFVGREEKK